MAPPKQSTNKAAVPVDAAEVASQGDAPVVGRTRHCLLSQLHKTKFCTYHLKGTCQYGKSCAFAHSYTELQGTPDLRKTRLCPMFQENGTCTNAGCTFAHGEDELRSTAMFFRKTLCIWNEKGRCRNGDQCRFAHGKEQLRASGKAPAATATKGIATLETGGRRQRQVSDKSGRTDSSGGSTCIGSGASNCSDEPMKINVGTMVEGAAPAPPPGLENGRRAGETLQQLDELRHNLSRALRGGDAKGAVVDAYFDPLLMGMGGYGFRGGLSEFVHRGFGDAGMHNPAAMDAEPTYLGDPSCMDGALAASLAQNLWGYGDSQALLGW